MELIKCHECALKVNVPLLAESQKAHCPRCGYVLTALHKNAVERILVFSITALIFLFVSLPFEFLSFQGNGLENSFNIIESINILVRNHYEVLAVLELLTIFIIPVFILLSLIYLLVPLLSGKYPAYGKQLLNFVFKLMPWSMVEIFLIGALVSLIKIISMADIHLGASFYAFIFFSLSMTAAVLHIDKHQLFNQLTKAENKTEQRPNISVRKSPKLQSSIQTTWALIVTSIILYIPANTLPIMTTRVFGQDDPSTILGGVILLWQMGSYPIAAVIFVASIAVPVGKILVLAWLNYSVQKQQVDLTLGRIKLYRIAEFVGRWSMVDVFVVIVLMSLIQLGDTMSIYPGAATLAFSGVVVLTMLAAMSFNPQLIWKTVK